MPRTSERRVPPRPPLRFDWSLAFITIDGEFLRVYRVHVGTFMLYAFKRGNAWRWGIAMHGTTIQDGTRGTLIASKHAAELAYGDGNPPRQTTISEATSERRSGDDPAPF